MKLPITTFAFCTLLTTFAYADSFTSVGHKRCDDMSSLAEVIMENRQSGVSMSKQIQVINANNPESKRAPYHELISMAYDRPRWSSSERREEAIADFGDLVYQGCYKSMTK